MRWLVTGGCGFIGTNLVQELLSEGTHSIRIIDDFSVGSPKDLPANCSVLVLNPEELYSLENGRDQQVQVIKGDVLDAELALRAAEGIDVITHLAANTAVPASVDHPRKDCVINIIGTLNYLEAARHNGVNRFVFASSAAPLGECDPPIHEGLVAKPISPYGASKLAGEAYCSAYYRTFGIETVALRFSNVFGPGSFHKKSVVANFIQRALSGLPLEIYGDGQQTRDFLYVDDLVHAIQLAANTDNIGGEVFQVGTNIETPLNELVSSLVKTLSAEGIDGINVKHLGERKGDMKRNFLDISKVRARLGWIPTVPLDIGLKTTLEWFLMNDGLTSKTT